MSAPRIILGFLSSFCQKLPKLVEIWRGSDKNNFAQFFLRHSAVTIWLLLISTTASRTGWEDHLWNDPWCVEQDVTSDAICLSIVTQPLCISRVNVCLIGSAALMWRDTEACTEERFMMMLYIFFSNKTELCRLYVWRWCVVRLCYTSQFIATSQRSFCVLSLIHISEPTRPY